MTDGILVLNKPQNWTSHDCVAVCRRVLGIKKIGHGGTLDPMAEGVLPVFIGRATRIMEYLDLDYKTYRCRAKLGVVTDTLDIWGNVEAVKATDGITAKDIENALENFRGYIEQTPPKYSALKVNGKKLYQYAREGLEVEIKPRQVHIKELVIDNIDIDNMEVTFKVTCSKGTYIRTICSDLGKALGCGCSMAALTRTASGIMGIDMALNVESVKDMNETDIKKYIMPLDYPLVHFGTVTLNRDRAMYFASGNSIRNIQAKIEVEPENIGDRGLKRSSLYKVYCSENRKFLGIGYFDDKENVLKADKIFVTRQEI